MPHSLRVPYRSIKARSFFGSSQYKTSRKQSETQTFSKALAGSTHTTFCNTKQPYVHICFPSLSVNNTGKWSPFLDLVERLAKVFGQRRSSACQNSGRTPGPVPRANCKLAPWSIWQTAYPSHCRKANSHTKSDWKPSRVLSSVSNNCTLGQYIRKFPGDTASWLMPTWAARSDTGVEKYPKTTCFVSHETTEHLTCFHMDVFHRPRSSTSMNHCTSFRQCCLKAGYPPETVHAKRSVSLTLAELRFLSGWQESSQGDVTTEHKKKETPRQDFLFCWYTK